MKWISDGMWKCGVCDSVFQVYVLDKEAVFSESGCPVCGVVVPPFKKIESENVYTSKCEYCYNKYYCDKKVEFQQLEEEWRNNSKRDYFEIYCKDYQYEDY